MTMSHEQRIGLRAQFEARARKDYAELKGKIVLVTYLCGYTEGSSDQHGIKVSTPARVRVVDTHDRMIVRVCGNWINPVYELDLLAPHEELKGYGSFDCYGTSYNVITGATEPAHFQIVADENPVSVGPGRPDVVVEMTMDASIPTEFGTVGGSTPIVITDFKLTEISMHTGSGGKDQAGIGGQAVLMHPPIDSVDIVQLGGETRPPGSREELEAAVSALYEACKCPADLFLVNYLKANIDDIAQCAGIE
jgi:hypothetical protein